MRPLKTVRWLGWALALLASATVAQSGIVGSAHDFSAQGWSQGEVCIVCHTPHHASQALDRPLWNHEVTTASFTLYSSATLHQTPEQPLAPSKSCLSCHDGTVAQDSFGGRTGTQFVTGDALIGTDLANDHPVSIRWDHVGSASCGNCHNLHGGGVSVLPFYDGKVECATCHEPHNAVAGTTKMLRKTIVGSALCLHCHGK